MVTYIECAYVFGWRVVMCKPMNEHQKDMCKEEIELHVHNMFTMFNKEYNTWGANIVVVKRREGRNEEGNENIKKSQKVLFGHV